MNGTDSLVAKLTPFVEGLHSEGLAKLARCVAFDAQLGSAFVHLLVPVSNPRERERERKREREREIMKRERQL